MSDTMSCPNCNALLPANATFCTSCGARSGEGAPESPPAAPAPPADVTRVDNPGLNDATQVFSPPPAATPTPPTPAPPMAAPPQAPWQPAETPSAPPAGPPASPPWNPPGNPPAPAWPQPPAGAPAPGWGAQPGAAPQWGAPVPSAASPARAKSGGSALGGLVALVGGILTLVGLFTAWVRGGSDQTLTGWSFASGDEFLKSNDPYLILGLGIAALVLGVLLFTGTARSMVRIAAIIVGVAIIATPIRDWLSIVDIVEANPGASAKQEFGFFLTIAGGVVTAIAALLPGKKTA